MFESKKRLRREKARLKYLKKEGLLNKEKISEMAEGPKHDIGPTDRKHKMHQAKSFLAKIKEVYEGEYKKLMLITVILLVLAIAQIGYQITTTGDFINRGVSLKGGITVTIPDADYDASKLESVLKEGLNYDDILVRTLTGASRQAGLVVDAGITDKAEIEKLLGMIRGELKITKEGYSVEMIGSTLGASFFKETFNAMAIAFVCMGIVVFIYFRVPVPTIAVMLAAFTDIVETLAMVNILDIKISTAGIAAFLMLIGYSVDTDILLSTRVLKRKEGTVMDGVYSAIKTGMMMTLATIVAVTIGLIFATSSVIKEIMVILLIGLIFDILNTWIQNVGILRWYLEKRPEKAKIKP